MLALVELLSAMGRFVWVFFVDLGLMVFGIGFCGIGWLEFVVSGGGSPSYG